MQLIRNIRMNNSEEKEKDIDDILKKLQNVTNDELRLKIELVRQFLLNVMPNLTEESVIDDEFSKFMSEERTKEIEAFASKVNFKAEVLKEMISDYEFSGIINEAKIMDNLQCGLLTKYKKTEEIRNFIIDNIEKYE